MLYPLSGVLDYTLILPSNALAATFPTVVGYTSEDARSDVRRLK